MTEEGYADLFTVAAARTGLIMACPDCREAWVIADPDEPVLTVRALLGEANGHWHECAGQV
jgi:hypothetical protein